MLPRSHRKTKAERRRTNAEWGNGLSLEVPQADLIEARRLIYKHGYLRRKEELEDAEQALCGAKAKV